MSDLPFPAHQALANAFDDDRFAAIGEFADKQISLWLSVREGAYRRERATLEIHCEQNSHFDTGDVSNRQGARPRVR